jgi:hypothetical protein
MSVYQLVAFERRGVWLISLLFLHTGLDIRDWILDYGVLAMRIFQF